MRKQHYMTEQERHQLEAMRRNKIPVREIARQLGFCERTIYYELRRGSYMHTCEFWDEKRYSAQKGQQKHRYNQTAKGRPLKIGSDHAFAAYIEHKIIVDRYSPAAALAAARKYPFATKICVSTLYSYIDKKVFYQLGNRHLWEKWKKKARTVEAAPRVAHPKLPSIENRPAHIGQRSERGHWEMDLIIGKAETSHVLLTLTERYSRQELIFKLPDRKAATIRGVFDRLERQHKDFSQRFKSLTTDNGSEFMEYDKLCRSIHGGSRFHVWYCHSYSTWEKGSVENHTSTKAAVIRNLIMSAPPSDTERMAQPLQLVAVQAYDVRFTITVALGGKQHITNDHITVPYGSELVDTQRLFIPAAFIRQQDYARRQKQPTLNAHDLIEIAVNDLADGGVEASGNGVNTDDLRCRIRTGTHSNKILNHR